MKTPDFPTPVGVFPDEKLTEENSQFKAVAMQAVEQKAPTNKEEAQKLVAIYAESIQKLAGRPELKEVANAISEMYQGSEVFGEYVDSSNNELIKSVDTAVQSYAEQAPNLSKAPSHEMEM